MSTHKTKIDIDVVHSFLNKYYSSSAQHLEAISGGEGAQAFSYTVDNKDFVIRINKGAFRFSKDQYAFKHFVSSQIPIPKVIDAGNMDDMYNFIISEKVKGVTLDKLGKEKLEKLIPELFLILDRIHTIDISTTKGYGKWGRDGN